MYAFIHTMKNNVQVGISFPKNLIIRIDNERGDISRSRYLVRMIEKNGCHRVENVTREDNDDSSSVTSYRADSS
jgi:hypothetical protein